MAYNKTKHLDAARKHLQQGKLPQAISEYQQILKNEPKDQVTLMTLGDLYVRQGETFQALEYFERLAKIFLNDGFTTKAIAIYKKVAKLAPEETRPLERLAELYVQQGVLSEARPIYLQLAEVQLKAGDQPRAAALLRKLLEAEPDNLRVRTRLAEMHLSMGQKKEAIETFHGAMQRVLDRGDNAQAILLADRILELDSSHQATFLLKVRALIGAGKSDEAANLLESLPNQDEGGETTTLLLKLFAESGQWQKAAALSEKVFARNPKNFLVAHRITNMLLESGDLDRARALIALIRDTMIDSGDHEGLALTITKFAELSPGQIEPLEWLVDLYGRASDSFRLPDALAQLAKAQEAAGHDEQALATYEKLLERTPEDETTRRMYMRLRAKTGREPIPEKVSPPLKVASLEEESKHVVSATAEPALQEETQRCVTQALTDVDLFSSYGLTQKAIDLLESALERAPQHTPILDRLLDLSVGAGNDRRTAELASTLEQIALNRNDRAAAERYAGIRHRYQRAAGLLSTEAHPSPPSSGAPQEFIVPIIEAELDEAVSESPSEQTPAEPMGIPMPAESVVHEVDLSDEWAALSQQLEESMQQDAPAAPTAAPVLPSGDPPLVPHAKLAAQAHYEPAGEVPATVPAFDFELQPMTTAGAAENESLTADALIADLAAVLNRDTMFLEIPADTENSLSSRIASPASPPATLPAPTDGAPAKSAPEADATLGSPLGDLFEEFRSELGETNKDDEDIETHYNLGIAYREMGLLEEAISEFQKVSKEADKGPTFRYAMQCSTLLGLAFMEKGQPAIAAIWYERALLTPGLDQESVMALRYDLGVAQELAGEKKAAFNSFSQVYAMNIDYRDVSERIALLGKAR